MNGKDFRRGRKGVQNSCKKVILLVLLVVTGFGVAVLVLQRFTEGGKDVRHGPIMLGFHTNDDNQEQNLLPLAGFPSLQYPLQNSQLVALYFAASWCPMSTPVTKLIHEHLDSILLPVPSDAKETASTKPDNNRLLSLVYVSSDSDEASMLHYKGHNWFTVMPFDSNSSERDELKRHFHTCAHREVRQLPDIDRQHGLPTLIIISAATQDVLTFRGVQDLTELKEKALDTWVELSHVNNALADKYA